MQQQNDPNYQANLAKRRFSLQTTISPPGPNNPNYGGGKFNANDIFVDQTNLQELRKLATSGGGNGAGSTSTLTSLAPPPQLAPPQQSYDPNSTYSRFLLYQQQQQQSQLQQMQQKQRQQAAQNQENFSNFMRLCSYSGIDLNTDLNNNNNDEAFFSGDFSTASTADSYSISSSQSSLSSQPTSSIFAQQQQQQFPPPALLTSSKLTPLTAQQTLQQQFNRRRCSFGPSVSSSLHPVFESRSSSPFTAATSSSYTPSPLASFDQQKQQQLEQKLSSILMSSQLITSSELTPPPTPTGKPIRGSASLQTVQPPTPLSVEPTRTTSNRTRALSTGSSVSSYDLSSLPRQVFADAFEEKLATTGNIFQKREDWSVLSRIPIVKQNTIHIRLEDEGPYGNDETRCFVLSHFSSLGIKELSCIVCSSPMIVFDRFPLVDGTLFLSPVVYDAKKSIAATVSGNKQQYINAICLSCILGEPGHEMTCKHCKKSLQSHNAAFGSVQIGTLYKYDLFAAFPCCKQRLTCKKCHHVIGDSNAESSSFSSFSDERECANCKTRDYHFIKPVNQIFLPLTTSTAIEQN